MTHRRLLSFYPSLFSLSLIVLFTQSLTSRPVNAQLPPLDLEPEEPPSTAPLPEAEPPTPLPSPDELLEPSIPIPESPEEIPGVIPGNITVERFDVVGSTVFSPEDFLKVTESYLGRPLSFSELFEVRSAITKLYNEAGYITTGAFIPPQQLTDGVVIIQVLEGGVEDILVEGTTGLNPGYVRSRLALGAQTPLNVNRLQEALQLLRLDPLIENLSAELSESPRPGQSLLEVEIVEADTDRLELFVNNGRSPSVGSLRRGIGFSEANLLGYGDQISVRYNNTDGSDAVDLGYTLPLSPHNTTLFLGYGTTSSDVIEEPLNAIDIESESRYYEITLRHPLIQTPTEEFAIGLTGSRQESETSLLNIAFPLSAGADDEGRTRVSAIRFFQEWTKRSEQQVLAARSQFSFGIDAFDSTINDDEPDSDFFAWRLQGQWVRLLAEDTLLLVRGDLQLANQSLVPLEQFGIGGQETVRGYRQDLLLTDSGFIGSVELRLPILRVDDWDAVLQLTPFVDVGTGFNSSNDNGDRTDPDPDTLVSVGLGLRFQQSDSLSIRLDYGIPLVDVDNTGDTAQEDGFHFSVIYSPF